ncbi:MAG TPA: prepilin-type N-terminal cleavage/methylation domain-containing protein [Persephonella sp.]|nr:prepilin-type N-terminal cleavage/methylation domain-containing protein [Persephonella sp.]
MRNKGFTLLELLLVVTLLLLVFSVIGSVFISELKGNILLKGKINRYIEYLSVKNQLTKQFFSKIEKRKTNFKLGSDGLSFYTLYPIFFPGAVRAEYKIEKTENNRYRLIYQEFPFIDENLGEEGLKKMTMGTFDKITFTVINNGKEFENYSDQKFPQIIKINMDDEYFYVTDGSIK